MNKVVLTDRKLLDSIDSAFKTAQQQDIQKGGAFEKLANVTVYKGSKRLEVYIAFSIYDGWFIEVGNEMLISDHMFALVKRYENQ